MFKVLGLLYGVCSQVLSGYVETFLDTYCLIFQNPPVTPSHIRFFRSNLVFQKQFLRRYGEDFGCQCYTYLMAIKKEFQAAERIQGKHESYDALDLFKNPYVLLMGCSCIFFPDINLYMNVAFQKKRPAILKLEKMSYLDSRFRCLSKEPP